MRMTQIIGLNKRAKQYVAGEQILLYTDVIERTFADGTMKALINLIYGSTVKEELSGEFYTGMWDEQFPLSKFTMPDGKVLFERHQATHCDSGPCAFYALQSADGSWLPDSLWTGAEIGDELGDPAPTPEETEASFRGLEG